MIKIQGVTDNGCKKGFNPQHAPLLEKWRMPLDKNLSKAFDTLNHDLLIEITCL